MDENKVVLPDEYKEKGWAKSILNDAGEVDMGKVFSKIDGQESLLGKKQIPGKNSTEEEWAKFNAQITAEYEDGGSGRTGNKSRYGKGVERAGSNTKAGGKGR